MLKQSWILFHKMQMFSSLRCRSLCILLLRVYASLRTTQNPLSWILFHKMQMFSSLRYRSLCILLLRVYASLRTTQNPLFSKTLFPLSLKKIIYSANFPRRHVVLFLFALFLQLWHFPVPIHKTTEKHT